jgi:hypothetical protein
MKFYFSGYIKLNSYLNKIGFNSSNLCDTCQQEETVEHFLLQCKQYNTYRQTMIDQLLQVGVTNFGNITILHFTFLFSLAAGHYFRHYGPVRYLHYFR